MIELDCGDRNCLFATDKSGMRTNGGCRCIPPGHSRLSLKVQEILDEGKRKDSFRTQAEAAENKLKKIMEKVDEVMETCPNLDEEHPYLGDVFDELRQIASTDVKKSTTVS